MNKIKFFNPGFLFLFLMFYAPVYAQTSLVTGTGGVVIEWKTGKVSGCVEIQNGKLVGIDWLQGHGKVIGNRFTCQSESPARIHIRLNEIRVSPGPGSTLVSILTDQNPFTFFLRDVTHGFPIYIPAYGVAVCREDDQRSYREIENDILSRGYKTKMEKKEEEPEASFESAAAVTRQQSCPIWLGISRDIRIFEISQALKNLPSEGDIITPRFASENEKIPESGDRAVNYFYAIGRGQAVDQEIRRYLEEGSLPILHSILSDDDIEYHSVYFVSLEESPLSAESIKGTPFLVADYYSEGHTFTPQQEELLKSDLVKEQLKPEETVLYFRTAAKNTGMVPRYAWFKAPKPGRGWWERMPYHFEKQTGYSVYDTGRVFCIAKINGHPMVNEEMAILIQPGDSAVFEFYLPHSPVSRERAGQLSERSIKDRQHECNEFWKTRLAEAAQIKVPEQRIGEMIKAGLIHLELITYGQEAGGTLAPCVGVYSPIGTESSPIIQFYASMGLTDLARRSAMYFLDKQHDDGMIQNFGGYMVETGAALWTLGECFLYSRDTAWLINIEDKLLRSCNYLVQWRNRNKVPDLRNRGYGLIDGKVADPEDPYHQFMLNSYGYLGLSRVAEILAAVDMGQAARLRKESVAWKQDIRDSFFHSMANSPVVPLGDGTWVPTVPPWTESAGPRSLYLQADSYYSHGTFTVPDALLGPMYLIFCGVLDPEEPAAKFLLKYHDELFYRQGSAFSQPYYSRHDWVELKSGLVKEFLSTYYHNVSSMADRETYTFWEHLFHVSVHKTHEEAWFLMETRWMLYLEEGDTLNLLKGVPRNWLEDGKSIELENVMSYFGPLSYSLHSHITNGYIEAEIKCNSFRRPEVVSIRIPHPEVKKAIRVSGGYYDEKNERVIIPHFTGDAKIRVEF